MIVRNENRNKRIVENMRGGTGPITFYDLTNDAARLKNIRLLSELVVKPGGSIGAHAHENESEVYFCISGEGLVLDEGEYVPFLPGDAHFTTGNDPHGIRNNGTEDLRFLALIMLD